MSREEGCCLWVKSLKGVSEVNKCRVFYFVISIHQEKNSPVALKTNDFESTRKRFFGARTTSVFFTRLFFIYLCINSMHEKKVKFQVTRFFIGVWG